MPRNITLDGLLLAFTGSVWAVWAGPGCADCQQAKATFGVNLAWLGVVYYSLLLAGFWRSGTGGWFILGVMAAVGTHLELVFLLWREELFCPACLLTATGAGVAGVAVSQLSTFNFNRHLWPLPVMALLTLMGFNLQQRAEAAARQVQADALLSTVLVEKISLPEHQVRLLVYARPDCRHCRVFEREMLPTLQREMGATLLVEHRSATGTLPTPSFVMLGRENLAFVGLPEYAHLRNLILQAQGAPAR